MSIMRGRELGVNLLKALGIEPQHVRKMTLTCDCQDGAVVAVERFITSVDAESCEKVISLAMEEYVLTKRSTT